MASNKLAQAVRRTLAMGPSVKNLLAQYNLDPKHIASTGPHQILLKSDVLSYISQKNLNSTNRESTAQLRKSISSTQQPASTTKMSQRDVKVIHISDESILKKKYSRRRPTQMEIDVINNGGWL